MVSFMPVLLMRSKMGQTSSTVRSVIVTNNLTWIDNLITGSGNDLGDPGHKNYKLPYVQDYLASVGRRKCEANSIVVVPQMGRKLCEDSIQKFLGKDALKRFERKRERVKEKMDEVLDLSGAGEHIRNAIELLDNYEE